MMRVYIKPAPQYASWDTSWVGAGEITEAMARITIETLRAHGVVAVAVPVGARIIDQLPPGTYNAQRWSIDQRMLDAAYEGALIDVEYEAWRELVKHYMSTRDGARLNLDAAEEFLRSLEDGPYAISPSVRELFASGEDPAEFASTASS